jgi:hypothetical protein
MKKNMYISFFIIVLLFVFSSCSSQPSNSDFLKPLEGKWNIRVYKNNYDVLIPNVYEKGIASFDFDTKSLKLEFYVSEQTISEKLLAWKEKWPDLTVDTYKIVVSARVSSLSSDKNLSLEEKDTNIIITGSGENFQSFYDFERSKFEMAKATESGGVMGGLINKAATTATGTKDLFPVIFNNLNYTLSGNNLTLTAKDPNMLNNKGTIFLKLEKID